MHGDKSQRQRERALARFEAGEVDALVATDVAARGIDVAGITHVINFDAPGDRDSYVHRVGRTGRAGRRGTGISFVLADQADEVRRMAGDLGLSREFDAAPQRRAEAGTGPAHTTRRRSRPFAGAAGVAEATGSTDERGGPQVDLRRLRRGGRPDRRRAGAAARELGEPADGLLLSRLQAGARRRGGAGRGTAATAPTRPAPKLRRAGLIEFEVRRAPDRTNSVIARACRTSRRQRSRAGPQRRLGRVRRQRTSR